MHRRTAPRATRALAAARMSLLAIAAALLGALAAPPSASASLVFDTSAPGFSQEVVASGLPYATAVTWAPDGRMFIALKSGVVRVQQAGALLAAPFVDISARVNSYHDRGLIGLALHPDFPTTPYVYLLYTHDPPGAAPDGSGARVSQLLRVTADAAQGYSVAVPGSEVVLLGAGSTLAAIGNPADGRDATRASCMQGLTMAGAPTEDCIPSDDDSHSIGTVRFGVDGSLFVGSGDGASYVGADARALRSQMLDSLAGKVMRIDPLTGAGLPDNPFYDPAHPSSNRSKVWSYGLRNPFRFTINPATNEPFIGDVGWGTWEEINTGKGANFGWPCYEGGAAGGADESGSTVSMQQPSYAQSAATSAQCAALYAQGPAAVRRPVFAYDHNVDSYGGSGGASAAAGEFYRGAAYPASFAGALFISDYSRRWIRYLTFDQSGAATVHNFARESDPNVGPVQLLLGPDTNLYVVMYRGSGSEIRRIRYTAGGNTPPSAAASADQTVGVAPLAVAFSSAQSFDPDAQPLGVLWDFGDGASSSDPSPSHTYAASGVYHVQLTVSEQTAPFASGTAELRITVGANPPIATIADPAAGTTYRVGDSLPYSGSGSAGGAPVPAGQLSWELRTHHNEHQHYDALPGGDGGSFTVPDHGDTSWLEFCLTATVTSPDGDLTDTQCAQAQPLRGSYRIESDPPGMHIVYQEEGIERATPFTITPVQRAWRTITAPAVQQSRTFQRWSDGVTARSRTFQAGATPGLFTAVYENLPPSAAASAGSAGADPLAVALSAAGSADPEGDPLTYQWAFGDGTFGAGPSPQHTYPAAGAYTATLTVTDSLGATGSAQLALRAGNRSPSASVAGPVGGSFYQVGTVLHLAGQGQDPEDGALAGPSLRWQVVRLHGGATVIATATGAAADVTLPDMPEPAAPDEAIEVRLTAVDSGGFSATAVVTLTPALADLSVDSTAGAVAIVQNGQPRQAPYALTLVVGSRQVLEAPAAAGDLRFAGWDAGAGVSVAAGSPELALAVPPGSRRLTARFAAPEYRALLPAVVR